MGAVLLACVWMFILGIFVGRGTAPIKFDIEKLQKELISLKEENAKKEKEKLNRYLSEAKKKTNLGFYEALKKDERETGSEESGLKQIDSRREKDPGTTSIDSPRTTRPYNKNSPLSPSEREGKNVTIQIASLRDVNAADAMVEELIAKGYQEAYRSIGNVPGKGIWYRVRIGYFVDKSEAQHEVNRLIQDKYTPLIVSIHPKKGI